MKAIKPLMVAMLGLSSLSITAYAAGEEKIVSGEVVIPTNKKATINPNPSNKRTTVHALDEYAQRVNDATWSENMNINTAMTVKIQALLDWNNASVGAIDGGWGMNSKKALTNFQKMQGIEATGKMNEETWQALTAITADQPVLVSYTITEADAKGPYNKLPESVEARSKLKVLNYESVEEMLAERFHMTIAYLKKVNPNKKFVAGETITVINTGKPLEEKVDRVVVSRSDNVLYAYHKDTLVASYPTTVGGEASTTPGGKYKLINKVEMPNYKATVENDDGSKKSFILPSGPNSPVGVVWMGLNKPSYGIHGSPMPERISRQSSLGCVRLTNWDALELLAVIDDGATVEIR